MTDSRIEMLESVFGKIQADRMNDVPIPNRNLSVEAVGFFPWQGMPLGILITPWFMNLMLLPVGEQTAESIVKFPGGEIPFNAGFEAQLGHFQFCSMFSPMFEFGDQDAARATATEILRMLFESGNAAPASTVSRRDFLRGAFGNESSRCV